LYSNSATNTAPISASCAVHALPFISSGMTAQKASKSPCRLFGSGTSAPSGLSFDGLSDGPSSGLLAGASPFGLQLGAGPPVEAQDRLPRMAAASVMWTAEGGAVVPWACPRSPQAAEGRIPAFRPWEARFHHHIAVKSGPGPCIGFRVHAGGAPTRRDRRPQAVWRRGDCTLQPVNCAPC
jgi:hypothetical protein